MKSVKKRILLRMVCLLYTMPLCAQKNLSEHALLHALLNGKETEVKRCLTHKRHLVNYADEWGNTPVLLASFDPYALTSLKQLLTTKKVDYTAANTRGYTPLVWAARHGNIGAVRLLLAQPSINSANAHYGGRTAFLEALLNNHWAVAQELSGIQAEPLLGVIPFNPLKQSYDHLAQPYVQTHNQWNTYW